MSGWVTLVEPPHTCLLPELYDERTRPTAGIGSVWACDCGQHWALVANDFGPRFERVAAPVAAVKPAVKPRARKV